MLRSVNSLINKTKDESAVKREKYFLFARKLFSYVALMLEIIRQDTLIPFCLAFVLLSSLSCP